MRDQLTDLGVNGKEDHFTISLQNRTKMRPWFIVAMVIVISLSILVTGCVSEPGKVTENISPAPSLPASGLPVISAPYQIYIKSGQHEEFTYRSHTITVDYTSAYPTQIIKVAVDGSEKVIRRDLAENPNGIDWKDGDLSFTLKPVVWEIREGQNIPVYESTWNTGEVQFAVRVKPAA